MSANDPDDDRKVQERRIAELKEHAARLARGEMDSWESETLSSDAREEFWKRVVDFDSAPSTTNFQQLTDRGIELKQPDAMPDEELRARLWEVIGALAGIRVFITQTNHLSDRELYSLLWHEVLREDVPVLPFDARSTWHVDLLGGWSDSDLQLYFKYYADDDARRDWLAEFPDFEMPPREQAPHDRDRYLPKPGDPWPPLVDP